jgi:hypothetical protein
MECPVCNVELKVTNNQLVKRKDGSYARRIRLSCVSPQCSEYRKIVKTVYHPVEVVDDDSAE